MGKTRRGAGHSCCYKILELRSLPHDIPGKLHRGVPGYLLLELATFGSIGDSALDTYQGDALR